MISKKRGRPRKELPPPEETYQYPDLSGLTEDQVKADLVIELLRRIAYLATEEGRKMSFFRGITQLNSHHKIEPYIKELKKRYGIQD